MLAVLYKATVAVESLIAPSRIQYPHPSIYKLAWLTLWGLYGYCAGLPATGLWVIGMKFSSASIVCIGRPLIDF